MAATIQPTKPPLTPTTPHPEDGELGARDALGFRFLMFAIGAVPVGLLVYYLLTQAGLVGS